MDFAVNSEGGVNRPLLGIRVLEIGEYIAAPLAAMMLADLGADVIKVERPPKGDPHRRFGPGTPGLTMAFVNCNRNKRSIVLDLKHPEGRSYLLQLVGRSDVVLISIRPRAMSAFDLGDERLAEANPSAVRLYVTGYGDGGPRHRDPAYDALLQSVTGLAYVQGGGGAPELLHTFVVDKVTALTAVQAVLAALLGARAGRTGIRLSISLLDAMSYFNFPDLFTERTAWDADGADIDGVTQAIRPVRTKDGWILISPVTGAQIGRAFEVVGHPEFKDVLRAYTERGALARKLVQLLESATGQETTTRWLELLVAADVPASPVLSIDEHLRDEQVVANRVYERVEHPILGPLRDVKYPVSFRPKDRLATYLPAPSLGQHTSEVLAELAH
jgi:crotonobetainyl-CoA:carnitine CoA-transferase CaiB-like acyl-CoA transferase